MDLVPVELLRDGGYGHMGGFILYAFRNFELEFGAAKNYS